MFKRLKIGKVYFFKDTLIRPSGIEFQQYIFRVIKYHKIGFDAYIYKSKVEDANGQEERYNYESSILYKGFESHCNELKNNHLALYFIFE